MVEIGKDLSLLLLYSIQDNSKEILGEDSEKFKLILRLSIPGDPE